MPPEVTKFGCDVGAVEVTARSLQTVLDDLTGGANDETLLATLGSEDIVRALHDFRDKSSDQREKVTGSVDAVRQMLQGLIDGVRQVDAAFAAAFDAPTGADAASAQVSPRVAERAG